MEVANRNGAGSDRERVLRYRLNRGLRSAAARITARITFKSPDTPLILEREQIRKILLVRATFRIGDSILATPAVFLFRRNFPRAKIDFIGPPVAKTLLRNLPVDHHYPIYQRLPKSSWSYITLLRQIRGTRYDLAIDLSCSKSALAAFIVGFSGARFRVGVRGRRDQWFNVRLDRPRELNKYKMVPELLRSLGLEAQDLVPALSLSPGEREAGRLRVEELFGAEDFSGPVVGLFVGGRKSWGKRWPEENFRDIATALRGDGARVIVFTGPDERDIRRYFEDELPPDIPVLLERNLGAFASLVAACDLFVCCDSGPMHLAAALGVRTVAIFLFERDCARWAPPPDLARAVSPLEGRALKDDVLSACRSELGLERARGKAAAR